MKKLIGIVHLLASAALLVPGAALAQEAPDTPESAGKPDAPVAEEIVVTAQKRSESIQSVPIAVSAFTGEALGIKLVDDAVDLSFSVPNLTVTDSGNASLRGVGNLAISSTAESGLAYHVNGVYINAAATESEYYDIQRIEVLRGPQGTLYGRNATAGVLNIITQGPTNELGGYVNATFGNFNTIKLRGAINLPVSANLATRLAGFFLDRKGYTRNIFNGNRIDDRHMYGLRSSTRLDAGDTTANLVLSYFEEDDKKATVSKGLCTKDPVTGCSPLSAGFGTPDTRTTIFNTLGVITGTLRGGFGPAAIDYFAGAVNPADLRKVNQDVDPSYFVREYNASLEINHDFGDLTLTSLSGYQNVRRNVLNDFDRFAPGPAETLLRPITFDPLADGNPITTTQIISARRDRGRSRQYYQEVRLASSFAGPFDFLLGANYYDQRGRVFVSITHPTLAARQQQRGFSAPFEAFTVESNSTTKSYGLFGEAYLDLGERTRLTGGLRYSNDKKTIETRQVFLDPLPDGSLRPFTLGENSKGTVTGRAVVDHRFTDRLLAYASLSRGYKAGGLNPGGPADAQSFAPEFLNAAEIGLKASTTDGAVRANLAGFYYDYSDLQIGQVGVTSAVTVNSDARVYGAEAELVFRPAAGLQLDAVLSYLDTRLQDFQSGDEGDPNAIAPRSRVVLNAAGVPLKASSGAIIKNLDGNRLPFSPKTKIALGGQYRMELGGGLSLTPRVDYYRQGAFFGTEFNKPAERFKGYDQTDIKLLLAPADDRWQLRAFVKNLFDNDDITRITQDSSLVGRFRGVVVLEPRTYGIETSYRF